MPKQTNFTNEQYEKYANELTDMLRNSHIIRFSQAIVDLRKDYRKGAVNDLLAEVTKRLELNNPHELPKVHSSFKLFQIGDRVQPTENLYSGGAANRCLATINQQGEVVDNNHQNSNRFISVKFDGESHLVVASASLFRSVDDVPVRIDETEHQLEQ